MTADSLRAELSDEEQEWLRVNGLRGAWAASDGRLTRLTSAVESIIASRVAAARAQGRREGLIEAADRLDAMPKDDAGSEWDNGYNEADKSTAHWLRSLAADVAEEGGEHE